MPETNLIERVSYVASLEQQAAKEKDGYDNVHTPLEDGVLREGGALVYTSPEVLVLLFQYAIVGIVYGTFSNLSLPVLTYYFHMTSPSIASAKGLMSLGWSLKVFYGMLSDCFPIMGYRRKPFILIGWIFTALALVIIACKPVGAAVTIASPVSDRQRAQGNGSTLALLVTIACFCYIMADVSCDAMVVEYAQREPEHIRGRLQSTVYSMRYIFQAVAAAIIGFLMNSPRYGGKFGFDISINVLFAIIAVPVVVNVVSVYFFLKDTKRESVHLSEYFGSFFGMVKTRAVWQIMIFQFVFNFFATCITSNASYYIQVYWAKVEPINSAIASVLTYIVFSCSLGAIAKWGTNWNWRFVLVVATLGAGAIDAVAQFLTIYDVVRSQWFYLGIPLTEQVPLGAQYIVSMFVIVELADQGHEGIVYGLMTTIGNLPSTFGTIITNVYSAHLKITKDDIQADTADARHDAMVSYVIVYCSMIVACLTILILPKQKAFVQELKRKGGDSALIGGFILFAAFAILVVSITGSMLSMFASTRCYLLAGGTGC
ncbi:hypothetical protein AeNC1_008259 [Aphanomyces euteiches]|nr:hypothetical protein AeNC1_008259 [Aphanomyces euteiches]